MSKQVREAAQYLLDHVQFSLDDGPTRFDAKLVELCRAWFAEHPEDDDDEAVNFEWYQSVAEWLCDECNLVAGVGYWKLYSGKMMVADEATRGDVRRLARALRVELGGS